MAQGTAYKWQGGKDSKNATKKKKKTHAGGHGRPEKNNCE